MGLSFSKFTQLLGSTYKNTKPVADAVILGSMGSGSMTRTPVISGSGQASGSSGLFASANTFFKSDIGKAVGTAVLNKALQSKQVEVRPAELRYAEQTETNDANLEVMRQKAEAAGFNPLTVLRAGGINAYSTRRTNIPSYAPALYSTKGPSYIETIAGAAAQSYFNTYDREEQKVSKSLKIAQQYADLDYTRAMTAEARNAGSDVSMDGKTLDGVFYPDLPPDSEAFRDKNNNVLFLNGKAQIKGKGFGEGPNWEYRVPLTGDYGITTDLGHSFHTTILEEASVGDKNDVATSSMFHGLAGSWQQMENAGIVPPLSSLNIDQMRQFLGKMSFLKNPIYEKNPKQKSVDKYK